MAARFNIHKYLLILFFASFIAQDHVRAERHRPAIRAGVLDLRSANLDEVGPLALEGPWEFYWRRFVEPEFFRGAAGLRAPAYLKLPANWFGAMEKGRPLPGYGFATFRLRVLLPENRPELLAVSLLDMSQAYRLFINGKQVAANGVVGETAESERPQWLPQTSSFYAAGPELDLVLHVSNFHHSRGGAYFPVHLGSAAAIENASKRSIAFDLLLFGCIMIMGLYYMAFFFLRSKETPPLFFSLFCLIFSVRVLFTGQKFFIQLFPEFPWELAVKIEFLGYYLAVPVFGLFMRSVFPAEFSRKVLWAILASTFAFAFCVVLTPAAVYSHSLGPFNLLTFVCMSYVIYVLVLAIRRQRSGAISLLLGFLALFVTAVNDILYSQLIIQSAFITPIGIMIFVLTQGFVLAQRFFGALAVSETLSDRLETQVRTRTEDLQALSEISKKINSSVVPDKILEEVARFVNERFGIDAYMLYLVNRGRGQLEYFSSNFPPDLAPGVKEKIVQHRIPLEESSGIHYFPYKRGRRVFLQKVRRSDYWFDNFLHEHFGFHSFLMIPLIINDRVIGIIDFSCYHGRRMHLAREELERIQQFCAHMAGAIQSARLVEEAHDAQLEARVEQLNSENNARESEILNQIAREVNSTVNLERIMELVASHVESHFFIEGVLLQLADRDTNALRFFTTNYKEFHTDSMRDIALKFILPLDRPDSLITKLVSRRRPMYFPHFTDRELKFADQDPLLGFVRDIGVHSALMVPMFVRDELIGMIYFSSYSKQLKLSRSDIESIARFCDQMAGAIQTTNLLRQVEKERAKSDDLLRNILPEKVATELKESGNVKPALYDSVSIMFTDFKGFTDSASRMLPQKLVEELDQIFEQFDLITEKYGLEKLKTIGDAYMCAGGLPGLNNTHPVDAVLAALEIQSLMKQIGEIRRETSGENFWELRLGIHTGPVVAGVIGRNKFAYDVWGDAVNVASRMETAGAPGRINVSGETYDLVRRFFIGVRRGRVAVKNRGELEMVFIDRIRPELAQDVEGTVPNARFERLYRELAEAPSAPASPAEPLVFKTG